VGFKWFVPGLLDGSSASAARRAPARPSCAATAPWTTDKDGIILGLLAAEITARTGRDPGEHYRDLERRLGAPVYERIDAPADARAEGRARRALARGGHRRHARRRAITDVLTAAPGNGAAIGGLKVVTEPTAGSPPALRHRGRLQDLRGELPRRRAPRAIQAEAQEIVGGSTRARRPPRRR
jgi:phosphoglucomutase